MRIRIDIKMITHTFYHTVRLPVYTQMIIHTYAQNDNVYRYEDDHTYMVAHDDTHQIYIYYHRPAMRSVTIETNSGFDLGTCTR